MVNHGDRTAGVPASTLRRRWVTIGVAVLVIAGAFGYGVAVGQYRLFPYSLLKATQDFLITQPVEPEPAPPAPTPAQSATPSPTPSPTSASGPKRGGKGNSKKKRWKPAYAPGEGRILAASFTDPLEKGIRLQNRPALSIDDVARALAELHVPSELFFDASERVRLEDSAIAADGIQTVDFTLAGFGRRMGAFAYFVDGVDDCGALVIPGSGSNQATAIIRGQSIPSWLNAHCDVYVLIKPNEDFRAIHDGRRKLGGHVIYAPLLNRGGSYAARYLIEAIAYATWMQEHYDVVGLAGLSQAGSAVRYLVPQVRPDFAIIASGFSVIGEPLEAIDINQIVVPRIQSVYSLDRYARSLIAGPTRFLLSYGRDEVGAYRAESRTRRTCKWFERLGIDVTCAIHDGGHQYPPQDVVETFLEEVVP